MSARRIIQISSYYPPHLGGQENAAQSLAKQLAAAGNQVHVLASTIGGGAKGCNIEDGVQVRRMRGFAFGHSPIMPRFPLELLRTARPDSTVHVHIGQAFTPEMVWLTAKLRHFKYIAHLHIDSEPSSAAGVLLPLYKRLVLRRVLQAASAVVVLNEKTLHIVRDTYRVTRSVYVMNNGIDEAFFMLGRPALAPKPPRTLRLLFVGRLSKQKNLGALLQALTLTKRKVRVDVVGDGEEREAVERAIAAYGLTNVTMHGRLGRTEVMRFYKTCDALIMPSLYEAQPLVLLEAMAARIPIIGTNVIGVADHIKGAGVIVEPTSEGLAEGIEQYDVLYASLPRMVERGYEIAQRLRWRHTLRKYEALYDAIARS